jgi:hypothetical protein
VFLGKWRLHLNEGGEDTCRHSGSACETSFRQALMRLKRRRFGHVSSGLVGVFEASFRQILAVF